VGAQGATTFSGMWSSGERSFDAVLLDAGGVLLLPDPEAVRQAFASLGATPDDETCRRAHYASMREVDRLGRADWAAVDRVFARIAGVPEERIDDAVAVTEDIYLRRPWVPLPRVAESLRELQDAGFAMAVVSNAEGTMERQLAEHRICAVGGGEAADVAVVVDSHVVGVEKPDPRIFQIALDALGISGARCVHVGDSVHFDVEGARAAGLDCVHVDPYGYCPDDDHGHIGSLPDLVQALAAEAASIERA